MPWGDKGGKGQGPWGGGNKPSSGGSGSKGSKPSGQHGSAEIEELFKKSQKTFKSAFGGGSGSGGGRGNKGGDDIEFGWRGMSLLLVGAAALWLSTGVYKVDPDEVGVELRFGEYSAQTEPGLHYHLPFPIESASTLRVTSINREEIGFRSVGGGYNREESRRVITEESLMLTGDRNIVSTQFEVQWRIKDAGKFLFQMRNPERMVRPIAETAMREVMGVTPLGKALSDSRQSMSIQTKELMQTIMDRYDTGIEVYEVNLLAVDAPSQVVDAFIDVLAAQQEKETLQNKAVKYRDGIVPVAQGQAQKMVKDAEAYSAAKVAQAQGETARFKEVYDEYKTAKDVTKRRIYLETMEKIMQGMNKVILSNEASKGVLPYLPLPEIRNKKSGE